MIPHFPNSEIEAMAGGNETVLDAVAFNPDAAFGTVPLVVDIDGTLLRSDLLWEGMIHLLFRKPHLLLSALPSLLKSKASFKARIARMAALDPCALPTSPEVLATIDRAKAEGRTVILASGCHRSQADVLARRLGASVLEADGSRNLIGTAKRQALVNALGMFDYVGNSNADLPVWGAARVAYAVNASSGTVRAARRKNPAVVVLNRRPNVFAQLLRSVRPHQWSKNTLLAVPAVAAHLSLFGSAGIRLLLGFIVFSFVASGIYLINDLVDVQHDREHPRKKTRPLAAGTLPLQYGLVSAAGLLLLAAAIMTVLPFAFALSVAFYAVLSLSYSFWLKSRLLVDVIALAILYASRVVAGAALAGVSLSRWFLVFAIFIFFALAVVKRIVELKRDAGRTHQLPGRAYRPGDELALVALGTSATSASCLVYSLYVTSPEVIKFYSRPDVLWLALPLLLYWQARVWIFTLRGSLDEDPIAFALKDRVSIMTALVFLGVVWVAT